MSVSVSSVSFASDDYSTSNTYTPLVSRALVEAAILHDPSLAGATDATLAVSRLRDAMPTAAAATALLASVGVSLNVLESPAVANSDQPLGGGVSGGGGEDGGGGGMAAVIVIVLLVLGCGAAYYVNSTAKGKPVTASQEMYGMNPSHSSAPPPPPSVGHALPPGWSKAEDPASGRTYYINAASGETTWHHPAAV